MTNVELHFTFIHMFTVVLEVVSVLYDGLEVYSTREKQADLVSVVKEQSGVVHLPIVKQYQWREDTTCVCEIT